MDDYENDDNIAAMINTINNETLDCMELFIQPQENFSTYTEVDELDDLTVFDDRVEWSTMQRDTEAWVIYDFGVDYFTDFQVNFKLDLSDVEAGDSSGNGMGTICSFSNGVGTFADTLGGDLLTVALMQNDAVDDDFKFRVLEYSDGVNKISIIGGVRSVGVYYCTFNKTGDNVWLWVYSDSARTILIETLSDTSNGVDDSYRYFYGVQSWDSAVDPNDHSSGVVLDIWLTERYLDGEYYTVNVLDGDPAIAILYNLTIPAGCGATMEFSTDNLTWVDHNNQAGFDTLIAGYEALDLRDIYNGTTYRRVNMTSDGSNTPRIWQERFVTVTTITTDDDGGLFPGLAIGISLLIIGAIYALEKRR